MKITLDRPEYRALNQLRGLPPKAHMLVMCSLSTRTGGTLEGSREVFDELVAHISGELAEGMVASGDEPALVSICAKIDPDCLDWLGM